MLPACPDGSLHFGQHKNSAAHKWTAQDPSYAYTIKGVDNLAESDETDITCDTGSSTNKQVTMSRTILSWRIRPLPVRSDDHFLLDLRRQTDSLVKQWSLVYGRHQLAAVDIVRQRAIRALRYWGADVTYGIAAAAEGHSWLRQDESTKATTRAPCKDDLCGDSHICVSSNHEILAH